MDVTILRTFALAGAVFCSLFGFLFIISPHSADSLNLAVNRTLLTAVNRTLLTLDTALWKRPRMSGGMLLLVSFLLLFFLY